MREKFQHFLIIVVSILLIFSIITNYRLSKLRNDISNQRSYIINDLEHSIRRVDSEIHSITNKIERTLEEQQKIIAEKSFNILGYNKYAKTADIRIDATFKEIEKDSEVHLKAQKGFNVDTISMNSIGGLSYTADIKAELNEEIKLSVFCEGKVLREESLFEIDLENILENRIRVSGGGTGTSYSQGSNKIGYSRDFEIINEHNKDKYLQINYCKVQLKANGETVFEQSYNQIYSDENFDRIKVFIGHEESVELNAEEDIHLELVVTATDNLNLTYEYKQIKFISGIDSKAASSTSMAAIREDKVEENLNQFRIK